MCRRVLVKVEHSARLQGARLRRGETGCGVEKVSCTLCRQSMLECMLLLFYVEHIADLACEWMLVPMFVINLNSI